MHIAEGILTSSPSGIAVAAAGFALAGIGVGIGLRRMDYEDIPRAGVLGAAFFTVSLVPIPVGAGSVHLLLTGLMGIILGWGAFPTVAVALALQAVFFGDGGLSALGINTLSMGLPAVVCGAILGKRILPKPTSTASELPSERVLPFFCGLCAGVFAVVLGTIIIALALTVTHTSMSNLGMVFIGANLALAPIEGLVTATALVFIYRVQPSLLAAE